MIIALMLGAAAPSIENNNDLPTDRRFKCRARDLQLSRRESFGVGVIESMACGCIPVVTSIGGLPETVGNVGMTVEFNDWDGVVKAIEREYDPSKGASARKRSSNCSIIASGRKRSCNWSGRLWMTRQAPIDRSYR